MIVARAQTLRHRALRRRRRLPNTYHTPRARYQFSTANREIINVFQYNPPPKYILNVFDIILPPSQVEIDNGRNRDLVTQYYYGKNILTKLTNQVPTLKNNNAYDITR